MLLLLAHAATAGDPAANGSEAPAGTVVHGSADDGSAVTLRVESVQPDPLDQSGEVHLYGMSVQGTDGAWSPYCQPDAEGRSAAIPVPGAWDVATGTLVSSNTDLLTFACTSGAIGKCVRFGYKPWGRKDGQSLADYHAACVRMVRGDYCGDGKPHTRDGTRIDVYDRLGVQVEQAAPGVPEEFEAGWSPGGATYIRVLRWSDDVASMVAECPEKLAGRTSLDNTCTDAAAVGAAFPETLLFNNRMKNAGDRQPAVKPLSGPQATPR